MVLDTIAATCGSTSVTAHVRNGFNIITAPAPVTVVINFRRDHSSWVLFIILQIAGKGVALSPADYLFFRSENINEWVQNELFYAGPANPRRIREIRLPGINFSK